MFLEGNFILRRFRVVCGFIGSPVLECDSGCGEGLLDDGIYGISVVNIFT